MSKPIEILRYLSTPPNGKRAMRIRGELYENVSDIPDERVQQAIRRSIAEMVGMAGGVDTLIAEGWLEAPDQRTMPPEAIAAIEIEPDAPASNIEALKAEEQATVGSLDDQEASKLRQSAEEASFLQSMKANQLDVDKPKPQDNSLLGRFRTLSGRQPAQPENQMATLDIATQINALLQARITKMPTFAGRHIELRSNLGGELLFMVDGRPYESMTDIQDKEAVAAFKSAISDWENR